MALLLDNGDDDKHDYDAADDENDDDGEYNGDDENAQYLARKEVGDCNFPELHLPAITAL